MNNSNESYLMNAKETAEFLHISYWNLMDLVRRKKIPHIRYSRQVFFKKETLENFINELESNSVK
ncbi:MAG: helix-turn-helix domain-containing protein [Firmicutes bacterium]|nr:helix-turn-helix domain-containing protein [Bacillota bacterium]